MSTNENVIAIKTVIEALRAEILERQTVIASLQQFLPKSPERASAVTDLATSVGADSKIVVARWVPEITPETAPPARRKHVWTDEQRKAAGRRAKAMWRRRKAAGGKATVTRRTQKKG
ncbi:MAG TPA: hypothetical protein VFW94_23665 [Candidatus Acidoferrales bacterium]|nr:hypothetical protein [Candidatus Acidoferrales bacterium]